MCEKENKPSRQLQKCAWLGGTYNGPINGVAAVFDASFGGPDEAPMSDKFLMRREAKPSFDMSCVSVATGAKTGRGCRAVAIDPHASTSALVPWGPAKV